jgi:hypothetical protein
MNLTTETLTELVALKLSEQLPNVFTAALKELAFMCTTHMDKEYDDTDELFNILEDIVVERFESQLDVCKAFGYEFINDALCTDSYCSVSECYDSIVHSVGRHGDGEIFVNMHNVIYIVKL